MKENPASLHVEQRDVSAVCRDRRVYFVVEDDLDAGANVFVWTLSGGGRRNFIDGRHLSRSGCIVCSPYPVFDRRKQIGPFGAGVLGHDEDVVLDDDRMNSGYTHDSLHHGPVVGFAERLEKLSLVRG